MFHQEAGDRELPLIIGVMPIISKAYWQGRAFDETTLDPIVGSGPYVIGEVKPGEAISYRKNPDYWGKGLALSKGLWNFAEVRYDYYRDANAAFEAFKTGLADIRTESDPTRWATAYDFPAVKDGKIVLEKIEQKSPAPASGFAFNTRRPIFADPRVREALVMAFDFEWANANLFSGPTSAPTASTPAPNCPRRDARRTSGKRLCWVPPLRASAPTFSMAATSFR